MMNEYPDTAILDGDIIVYKAACWAEANGKTLRDMVERVEFDLKFWTPTETYKSIVAFSCSTKDNYRLGFHPEYKANRKGRPRPKHLDCVRKIVEDQAFCVTRDGLEADDLVGIGMSSGSMVGVSLDKDLRCCPGWFWNPDKMCFPELISQDDADYAFHLQWLTGDSTDNIPGIPGIGPKKAEKLLNNVSITNQPTAVLRAYEDKGLDLDYCLSQARCVRILRDGEYNLETGLPVLYDPF